MHWLNQVYTTIFTLTQANPVLGGIVGLWGLGVITFAFRKIPLTIWNFVLRQSTTTVDVLSSDNVYYDLLRWVSKNKMHSFVRTLTFNNTRHGWGESSISLGYGKQFFRYNKKIICMTRTQKEANMTSDTKEQIEFTVLGRSHVVFTDLFNTVKKEKDERNKYIVVNKYKDGWRELCLQYKRDLGTIAIPKKDKEGLISHIQEFFKSKQWHLDNGIPWRTGILLFGPPGTGKTSLIKGICSYFNKELYMLEAASLTNENIVEALSSVPEGSIVAIEDIDSIKIGKRKIKEVKNPVPSPDNKIVTENSKSNEFSFISLSGVLNAIDGPASGEGRILIATTNCPESLDPALVREGRFDLKLQIGYMGDEAFHDYLTRIYPNFRNLNEWKINPNVAPCKVQALVFQNKNNPQEILKAIAHRKDYPIP